MRKDSSLSMIVTVLLAFVCLMMTSGTAGASLSDGCVLHLSFDEGSGTTAYDSSGYGNNGTLGYQTLWTPGKFGSAVYFSVHYASGVLVPTVTDASLIENAYTLSFWINTEDSGFLFGGADESTKQSGATQVGNIRGEDGTSFYAGKVASEANGAGSYCWSKTVVSDGEWHYVVFTFADNGTETTNMKVYVDSVLDNMTTTPYPIERWATDHTIGNRLGQHLNGSIDEFSIYSRELSEAEITSLYTNGSLAPVPVPPAVYLFGSGFAALGFIRRRFLGI